MERGSATAEFAVVLPAVMVLAVLLLSLTRVSMVSMACQDAANQVARVMVSQSDADSARRVAASVVGEEASVTIGESSGMTEVVVSCPVMPGPLGVLPTHVEGRAYGLG